MASTTTTGLVKEAKTLQKTERNNTTAFANAFKHLTEGKALSHRDNPFVRALQNNGQEQQPDKLDKIEIALQVADKVAQASNPPETNQITAYSRRAEKDTQEIKRLQKILAATTRPELQTSLDTNSPQEVAANLEIGTQKKSEPEQKNPFADMIKIAKLLEILNPLNKAADQSNTWLQTAARKSQLN